MAEEKQAVKKPSAREERLLKLKAIWDEIKAYTDGSKGDKGVAESDLLSIAQRIAGVKPKTAQRSYIDALWNCGNISREPMSIRDKKTGAYYSEIRVVANPNVPPGEASVPEWETERIK